MLNNLRILIVFFVTLNIFTSGKNLDKETSGIVGGEDALKHEFPFIVALLEKDKFLCGGTIISDRWILTAAHCIYRKDPTKFTILAGKHSFPKKGFFEKGLQAKKFIVHDKFNHLGIGPGDIGLILLKKSIKYSKDIKPIWLPKKNVIPSGQGIIAGWGSISYTKEIRYPSKLQTATVTILDYGTCLQHYGEETDYDNTNICTGPYKIYAGQCTGDSGGPMIQIVNGQKILVGVMSYSNVPCGKEHSPPVLVRVSHYIDWITRNMANTS